jgi:hypothetical protein
MNIFKWFEMRTFQIEIYWCGDIEMLHKAKSGDFPPFRLSNENFARISCLPHTRYVQHDIVMDNSFATKGSADLLCFGLCALHSRFFLSLRLHF